MKQNLPRNHGSAFDRTENIPLDLLLVYGIAFDFVGLNGRDVGDLDVAGP